MGYFDRVDDRVTVSLHILYTASEETEGSIRILYCKPILRALSLFACGIQNV